MDGTKADSGLGINTTKLKRRQIKPADKDIDHPHSGKSVLPSTKPNRARTSLAALLSVDRLHRPYCWYVAETAGGGDRYAVHEPNRGVADVVAPQQIAHSVSVIVADQRNRPRGRHTAADDGR